MRRTEGGALRMGLGEQGSRKPELQLTEELLSRSVEE